MLILGAVGLFSLIGLPNLSQADPYRGHYNGGYNGHRGHHTPYYYKERHYDNHYYSGYRPYNRYYGARYDRNCHRPYGAYPPRRVNYWIMW